MNKANTILTITTLSVLNLGVAAEMYQVRNKDSLIKIIKHNFAHQKIFGQNGMLRQILDLNPKIKNANLIFVNQKIRLPEVKNTVAVATIDSKSEDNKSPDPSEDNLVFSTPLEEKAVESKVASARVLSNDQNMSDSWFVKALYGINFTSIKQSKTLSAFSLTTTSNPLKFESEFKYDDYKFIGSYESHLMTISSENISHQKRFSQFDLQGSVKNYLVGFSYRENPIIKGTTTTLELSKEGQVGVVVGYDKNWSLPTTKPTSINLRSLLFIPLSNNSDRSDLSYTSVTGFEISSLLELSRTIIKRQDLSLELVWQNEVRYGSTSRKINWGASSGPVNLSKIEVNSLIGLGIRF